MRILTSLFDMDRHKGNPEDRFDEGASLEEGISGRVAIDTEFENNLPPGEIRPRGGQSNDR